MLSKFFLKRPVFAWVIAIILMLGGIMAINTMPISQYPTVAPPSISVRATYTGGSAETVENSVTQIIEQEMTGFDSLLYQSATSDSSGSARLELTFDASMDPNMAWSQVQNKLQLAMTSLPSSVQSLGVEVDKSTKSYLMMVGLISQDGSLDGDDLRDYAKATLESILARVQGVGEVEVFGGQYAMRIWVDTDKLVGYNLTFSDIAAALNNYNVEVAAGQFGTKPATEGQRLNASILVQSFLQTPEEFDNIPLRSNDDGSVVRIKDIGYSELGAESYDIESLYNGVPSATIGIRLAAGANALQTAENIRERMIEMKPFLPTGVDVVYPYDTTPFIQVAIDEVVKTLIEAIILVFFVMYIFMGTMRATLIPTIAVPVVILGTFFFLHLFGYSINMLTMFAMVLAIGLLVDDAIVVVENVERLMHDEGLSPRAATEKSMNEITSALVGIGLVLSAVFGPMAFFGGSTGIIYRQFSVTIVVAMFLSVIVALVLTPVLCAAFLKPVKKGVSSAETGIPFMRPFFRWFDRTFNKMREEYVNILHHTLSKKLVFGIIFLLLVGGFVHFFGKLPTSYLPDEDQGVLLMMVSLPTGATAEQTDKVLVKVQDYFKENEADAVESTMSISGFSFGGRGQNQGVAFIKLKDWHLRDDPELKVDAITARVMKYFSQVREAQIYAFSPPPIMELGQATGSRRCRTQCLDGCSRYAFGNG